MKRIIPLLLILPLLVGCGSRQSDTDKTGASTPAGGTEAPSAPAGKRDVSTKTLVTFDPDIQKYDDEVSVARAAFDQEPSDDNRDDLIKAHLAFGNYMENGTKKVSPRQGKYLRALVEFRAVIDLDPKNQNALKEISLIEDIYRGMNRPIPEAQL
jgi:hypothetical protein